MEKPSVFRSKDQAVRLPESAALPDVATQVDIVAVRRTHVIAPWTRWFNAEGVSEDFMNQRGQPADQEREASEPLIPRTVG